MSKDPNTNPPPKAGGPQSLEDLVYRSSLAEGNTAVQKANPLVAIPATIMTYVVLVGGLYQVAKRTEVGQKIVKKTMGIDLNEDKAKEEDAPPPPPPPPPAPPAPAAPRIEVKDAPPPPPINPNQDIVPEVAPKELPQENRALAYAGAQSGSGASTGAVGTGGPSTGPVVAGSAASARVHDFDFSAIKVKVKPPVPPYPAIARIAKIQGTVIVEIIVGVDGVPVSAKALEGPAQLRSYAENYAMGWRFEPAQVNGAPVQAKFKLTMPFRLQ